jgi:putative PIN family toxin of toxin-antitoxin system
MRVLLDTNVIVSAVTTRGLCSDVFRAVLSDHDLVTCRKILHEIQRILRSKFSVPAELIAEYVELLSHDAIMAEPGDMAVVQIKDRDDVEIIAAAITGAVDVLVTGDAELQALTSIQGVRVLSPRAFWEELKAQHGDVPDGR